MKFSMLQTNSVGSKEIGAFYGVNRTNKINDYQMSDMKNMDCESFPYLSTRRERELFYNENKMAAICHDTDITDDYKVTGVTEDGNFVYRGNFINCDGELAGNTCMCEYLGDYVIFPKMQVITSRQTAELSASDVHSFLPVYVRDSFGNIMRQKELSIEETAYTVYTARAPTIDFDGTSGMMNLSFSKYNGGSGQVLSDVHNAINLGDISPGKTFSLAFYKEANICPCPDDVIIIIDSIRVYGYSSYADTTLEEYSLEEYFDGALYSGGIYVNFKVYDLYGNEFNYLNYLIENEESISSCLGEHVVYGESGVVIGLGIGHDYSSSQDYVTMKLGECQSVACMGATYGGRLFACDIFGVDVFYSASPVSEAKKYDFAPGTSAGDAGAVSCTDHGRWTALMSYGGALYAFKRNGMYRIYSSDGLSFYMEKVCDVGAISQKCVCVVSDVMYFLSENGLYRFTGTYPEELPDNLGRRYTDGVLGGYDNKVYCSLSYSGGCELVIYDASVGAFGVHDDFNSSGFVVYGGKLYGLNSADGYVYKMSGERSPVEFSMNTRRFFVGFEKKAINAIRLYFDFSGGENEHFEVFVSYDGGEWESCFKPITSGKLKYVPIKFKKCDELTVRIQGYGVFTLKGMTLSLYSGGDIKQNK